MTNDEINDKIDKWHDGEYECSLHEFLGMTFAEYSIWVTDEKQLKTNN
jgi:hypothetical protein